MPFLSSSSTAPATARGVALGVLAERPWLMWRGAEDPDDLRLRPAVEYGDVLGDRQPMRGIVERGKIHVPCATLQVASSRAETVKSARSSASASTRRRRAATPS